jgi:hypothetical protein
MDEITLYELLLFAHLSFVAIWVGGDVMLQVFYLRSRSASGERRLGFIEDVEWIGGRILTPSALLVVIFGFGLIGESEGAYELSQTWVWLGLAAFVASFALGAGFLGPESGRIGKLAEERGVDDPEVERRTARLTLLARLELVMLFAVIFDMVVKPGL